MWPTNQYRRQALRTSLDVIVSIGGILGLFLGASLLSAIEFVYYFTIRAINNRRASLNWRKCRWTQEIIVQSLRQCRNHFSCIKINMRYHIALKEGILVSADIWATSSTRLQLNVVCAHSWLLLNICSTRTTAMRIKNALVAWMRNGGKKCEACGINGTCNLPGQSMHAVTSSWSSLLLLSCSRSYGQEISFVVFKYLRCINNANGEMSLKADTEKVATLILGLFSHCLLFFFLFLLVIPKTMSF